MTDIKENTSWQGESRELKFRAWSEETGKMYSRENIQEVRNLQKLMSLKFVKTMQYTWLKDKNWKEIYEWDIVLFEEYNKTALVVYERAKYVLQWLDKDRPAHIPSTTELSYREFETNVIWNIYQNPELQSEK